MNNTKQKFGGRTKGTPNKATAELRERFTSLLESNFDTIQNDLNDLEPKDRIKTLLEISKFVIPTLKAVENKIETDLENLRFEFDQRPQLIFIDKGNNKNILNENLNNFEIEIVRPNEEDKPQPKT